MEYYGGNFYPACEELSPMIAPAETRLDQLEALASTTLLAIRELANRQEATQRHLDSLSTRQEASQTRLDSEHDRFREFDQRMDRLSVKLEEVGNRQEATQKRLDSEHDRFKEFDERMDRLDVTLEKVGDRLDRVSLQQELNGQQIASNTAGLVELRNLVADFVRGQGQT